MPSTMPVPTKPRPYRRFANSALHSNFVYCIALTTLWHLILQGLLSYWYISVRAFFWAFFPVSYAGFKTLLFNITSILLFFHQIATLNTGKRCYTSRLQSVYHSALSSSTYFTFLWYVGSALWFSEIFAFTAPSKRNLHWTINGGYGAPDKLNERPIYLRTIFVILAIIHASAHLYYDLSSVPLNNKKETESLSSSSTIISIPIKAPRMLQRSLIYSAVATVVSPFLYHGLFRPTFWSWHIAWAKLFANIPKSEQNPPNSLYLGSVIPYGFILGAALSLTWQLNIVLFETFMLREPVKNGLPLSTSSKDPNGTLLNGLSAKSQLVKTLAFWELDIISRTLPERRKNIYGDFERPMQKPIFSSMISAALSVVESIQVRIAEIENTEAAKGSPAPTSNPQSDPNVQRLPRLLPDSTAAKSQIYQDQNAPARRGLIGFASNRISQELRTIGSSKQPLSPHSERASQLYGSLVPEAERYLQEVKEMTDQLPISRYFSIEPSYVMKSAILGSPIAMPDLIIYAISSTTRLLVASLTEDAFGKAVQCVPETIQCFANAVFAIEGFVQKHTNGGYVSATGATELADIVLINTKLKESIKELSDKFQLFLNDVGMSIRDLNETRKAINDRALFRVIDNSSAAGTIENQAEDPAPRQREMVEVSDRNRSANPDRRRSFEQPEGSRRGGQRRTEESRPGRLFRQLDTDSTYQDSLRERRDSTDGAETARRNPLISNNSADNVLGAVDPNRGGLHRRTARVQ